jgi:hypothetical protein
MYRSDGICYNVLPGSSGSGLHHTVSYCASTERVHCKGGPAATTSGEYVVLLLVII